MQSETIALAMKSPTRPASASVASPRLPRSSALAKTFLLGMSTLLFHNAMAETPAFSWQQTDTSLALRNDGKIVWRLVFDAKQTLKFTYRVLVHSRPMTAEQLENEWRTYTAPAKP